MHTSGTPLFNRLSVRIVTLVFLLLTVGSLFFYLLVIRTFEDFATEQVRAALKHVSHEISLITASYQADADAAPHMRSTKSEDEQKQAALRKLHRFFDESHARAAIFEKERLLLTTDEAMTAVGQSFRAHAEGSILRGTIGQEDYFLYRTSYAPWQWDIVVAKDTAGYLVFFHRVQMAYLFSSGIFIGIIYLIHIFVRNSIQKPIESIITLLGNNQKPRYRGIVEFEQLGATLSRILDEKERLVHQLMQDQIMENLRVTTRGVVHNFNNILVGALGYASLGKMKLESAITQGLPAGDKTYADVIKYIEAIEVAAERASALSRKLSSIAQSRGLEAGQYVSINPNLLLQELQPIVKTIFPSEATVQFELGESVPFVKGNTSQLEQVVLNLCINSRDAMPDGGTLTVRSGFVPFARPEEVHPLQKAVEYVTISVNDTGHGMDEEALAKAFEPFFTTKPMDQGSGLGLIVSDVIVKAHGGFITLQSTPGTGTTAIIYLPVEATSA